MLYNIQIIHKIRPVLISLLTGTRTYTVFYSMIVMGVLFVLGCSESSTEPKPAQPSINLIRLDSDWIYDSDLMRKISVRINVADYGDLAISCQIKGASNQIKQFKLYDDGGAGIWKDSNEFADSLSEDTVPGNGVFSRKINSLFADDTGEYIFTFIVSNPDYNDSLSINVTVRENSPPEFISHSEDDSVFSGGIGDIFRITLSDVEGHEDISNAEVVVFRSDPPSNNTAYFEMDRIADDRWSWNDKATISKGLTTGDYAVAYRAQDAYLSQISEWTYSDTFSVWLENLPPTITSVEGKDTVWLPQAEDDIVLFDYKINIKDDQSPTDLDTLYLTLLDSDSMVLARYFYIDGLGGLDTIGLDGIYHAGFSTNGSRQAPAEYKFKWTPTDKAGNRGETFESHLLFLRSEENSSQSGYIYDYDKAIHKQSHSPFK